MSRHDPKVTLRQLIEHAQYAQEICGHNTLAEIVTDWQKRAAFERVMEILGEAVKRLPQNLTAKFPQVDWRGIAGMRDWVSHGYDGVDYDLLWQSVEKYVPELIATCEQMLRELESGQA